MIIKNVNIFTNDHQLPFIKKGYIQFDDEGIKALGTVANMNAPSGEKIVDGHDGIVFPALVNAHASIYTSLRSFHNDVISDSIGGVNFFKSLIEQAKDKSWEKLNLHTIKTAIAKSLSYGITTLYGPIFYSENLSMKSLQKMAYEYNIQLSIGPLVFKDNINYVVDNWVSEKEDTFFHPTVYVAELPYFSKEELDNLKKLKLNGIDLNLIILDMEEIDKESLSLWGEHIIDRIIEAELLGSGTGLIYGGNLTETDKDILANRDLFVIKSPRSELYSGIFEPNVSDLLGRGMKVCLGSGFLDFDVQNEVQALILGERQSKHFSQRVLDYEVQKLLFTNNYKLLEKHFGKVSGMLREGYPSDIVFAKKKNDFSCLELINTNFTSFMNNILKAFDITDVWSNGDKVLNNGKPTKFSKKEIKDIYKNVESFD
jgi:cytosine/adenosine deaminase-related metal-dependent hydrolase